MSSNPLVALLPEFGEVTQAKARRWVTASLAEGAALREYDGWLYPRDPARLPTAERLRDAWRRWVADAEEVLRRAESVISSGSEISDLDALRDMVGHTRAMLQLTPAMIAQRREQVERGEVYTLEEIRRELRAKRGG